MGYSVCKVLVLNLALIERLRYRLWHADDRAAWRATDLEGIDKWGLSPLRKRNRTCSF